MLLLRNTNLTLTNIIEALVTKRQV